MTDAPATGATGGEPVVDAARTLHAAVTGAGVDDAVLEAVSGHPTPALLAMALLGTDADDGRLAEAAALAPQVLHGDGRFFAFDWLDPGRPTPPWVAAAQRLPGLADVARAASEHLADLDAVPSPLTDAVRRLWIVGALAEDDLDDAADAMEALVPFRAVSTFLGDADRDRTDDVDRLALLMRANRAHDASVAELPGTGYDEADWPSTVLVLSAEALCQGRPTAWTIHLRTLQRRLARHDGAGPWSRHVELLVAATGPPGEVTPDVVEQAEAHCLEVAASHPGSWLAQRALQLVVDLARLAGDDERAAAAAGRLVESPGVRTTGQRLTEWAQLADAHRRAGRLADALAANRAAVEVIEDAAERGRPVPEATAAALHDDLDALGAALAEQARRTPPPRFRVFVSSTFADFEVERDRLHDVVFPRLAERHAATGAQIEPVDLRWGVDRGAAERHDTMDLCLTEIDRSRRVTPRPCMLVLLGDRLGWRPLPSRVEASRFDELLAHAGEGRELLETWYELDTNAVEPERHLRPRPADLDDAAWAAVEQSLRGTVDRAAAILDPSEPDRRLVGGATEQEILHGVLDGGADRAVVVLRTITGAPAEGDPVYVDRSPDRVARLDALRAALRTTLTAGRVIELTVPWDEARAAPAVDEAYEARFADLVAVALDQAIAGEVARLAAEPQAAGWEATALVHERYGAERADGIVGRVDELARIAEHVTGPDRRTLLVTGEGGTGKSALLAAAADQARGRGEVVVARFIGADGEIGTREGLLRSVAAEVEGRTGVVADVNARPDHALWRQLTEATGGGAAVTVVVDGYDQLTDPTTEWIPGDLPAGVALVLSARPELDRRDLGAVLLELRGLDDAAVAQLLDDRLRAAGRTLTPVQRRHVLDQARRAGGNPLFVRLAAEIGSTWASGDGTPPRSLADDLETLVHRDLVDHLTDDRHHGTDLVDRSLGYLAAAGAGLTEPELVEAVSSDPVLYRGFLLECHHLPTDLVAATAAAQAQPPERAREWLEAELAPSQADGRLTTALDELLDRMLSGPAPPRLPRLLWSRLSADLAPLLSRRSADGVEVLGLLHRELETLAQARLGGDLAALHGRLADLFLRAGDPDGDGSWRGGDLRARRRALAEAPRHLVLAGRSAEAARLLTDVAFLEQKAQLVPDGVERLLADLDLVLASPSRGGPAG